jgi:hypothetical protein
LQIPIAVCGVLDRVLRNVVRRRRRVFLEVALRRLADAVREPRDLKRGAGHAVTVRIFGAFQVLAFRVERVGLVGHRRERGERRHLREVTGQQRVEAAAHAIEAIERERAAAAARLERPHARAVQPVHGRIVSVEERLQRGRRALDRRAPGHVETAVERLLDLEVGARLAHAIEVPSARGLRGVQHGVAHGVVLARDPPTVHVARLGLVRAVALRPRPVDVIAARIETCILHALPAGRDLAVAATRALRVAVLVRLDDAVAARVLAGRRRKDDVFRASRSKKDEKRDERARAHGLAPYNIARLRFHPRPRR